MLDEAIITCQDVQRAFDLGIRYIKLKLFKQGGVSELIHLIDFAASLNMHIVLGNGVATSLGNKLELLVHQRYNKELLGASEANGYLKLA